MANVNNPFGFIPIKHMDGSEYNGQINLYSIDASQAELFKNDLVTLSGDSDVNGIPGIARLAAGTGNPSIGSIVSFVADREDQGKTSNPASTAGFALVADAPDIIFEAQIDTVAASNFGVNAPIDASVGSSVTGNSAMQISSAGLKATTDQIRLMRLKRIEGNELGAFAVIECFINEHVYKQVAGVA